MFLHVHENRPCGISISVKPLCQKDRKQRISIGKANQIAPKPHKDQNSDLTELSMELWSLEGSGSADPA